MIKGIDNGKLSIRIYDTEEDVELYPSPCSICLAQEYLYEPSISLVVVSTDVITKIESAFQLRL